MRDIDGGSALRHLIVFGVEVCLRDRIERRSRLIQQDKRRILVERTRQYQALCLTSGEKYRVILHLMI